MSEQLGIEPEEAKVFQATEENTHTTVEEVDSQLQSNAALQELSAD